MAPTTPITVLVHEYANGDKAALDRLLPFVYTELRHRPRAFAGRAARPLLCSLPRSYEMYARLAGQVPPDVRDRIHFLSVAGRPCDAPSPH